MNILETIIAHKKKEVAVAKVNRPLAVLKTSAYYRRSCYSLAASLLKENASGIIAEFKRRSPSKGAINETVNLADVVKGYDEYGASGISVLTDKQFFGGSLSDLESAADTVECPLLRKDFIVDAYQLEEAKAAGADVALLIAAVLTPQQVKDLSGYAGNLGLEILLELHNETELDHICDEIKLVGVNNRNLETFSVDTGNSLRLAESIPSSKIKIAESGIDHPKTISLFREKGFSGFLMGEYFMKQQNPALAFKTFTESLKK